MSSESIGESLCDGQHEFPETAAVICLVHKDFLCLQCLISGEKKPECVVKQLDKLSPSENRLFEVLKVKKRLAERKDLIQSYTKTVSEKRDELKTQVKDHAEELVQKVRKNEEITLKDIETQAKTLFDNEDDQMKQIQKLESEISVKTKDADNITQKEVNHLHKMLENVAVMNDKTVVGNYIKKMALTGISNGLGTVHIHENLDYDEVQDNAEERIDKNGKEQSSQIPVCHDVKSTDQPPEAGPKPPIRPSETHQQNTASEEAEGKSEKEDTAENSKAGPPLPDRNKPKKSGKGFLGIFREGSEKKSDSSKGKGSSETQETPYLKLEFLPFHELPELKGKQIHVNESSTKQKRSKTSITNILVTDQNALILFDEINHRFIVSNFSGEIAITHKLPIDPIKITAFEENSFAILNCKQLKMEKFRIQNKELKISDMKTSLCVQKSFHVLGFEYEKIKKQFALSGIEEGKGTVHLINASTGEVSDVSREFRVSSTGRKCNPNDFKTLYDFEKDGVYILNTSSNTMKRFSFVKKDFDWKIQCKDASFAPGQVVFDEQNLYITSKNNITLFSKESGETKTTRTARVGNLKAICLMIDQRTAIVSCDSSDSRKSMTLEYIAL
ncbi:uncharacterized protein LOC128237830 [Mya arenaria]|uniref:uncharacterized protein LOC128237830 n=1 Tax=Mya arenaria TaxID=6604 RepID=UPI0022E327FF|nr:uncharacterized protein LOC128237830 [Mya arenaria]